MSRRSRTLVLVGVLSLLIQAVPAMSLSTGGNGPAQVSGGELPGGDTTPIVAAPIVRAPADTVLLPAPANGDDAVAALGDLLDEAAARNGMTTAQFEEILSNDETAWVDSRGLVYYVEPVPPAPAEAETVAKGPYPYSETFKLHSKPDSNRVIYLDFNGHTITNSAWHSAFPGTPNPWKASSFDTNGNPNSFSNGEKNQIQSIWQRVAEDYAPFDIDVTTEAPPKAEIKRSGAGDNKYGTRVVITDSSGLCWNGSSGCGGVAYIGAVDFYTNFPFPGADHDLYQPAWVFDNALSDQAKYIAEAVSHEAGHNLGLIHDGVSGVAEYYVGHEPWAPIMGVGYYQPVVQWSKGEYTNPTNTENDYLVMASHGIVERADDHTNTILTATPFAGTKTGVIASEADVDSFKYLAPSNTTATFTATPAPVSPNLDIVLRVYDVNGVQLAESKPLVDKVNEDVASGMGASISLAVTKGTVYYVQVSGDSYQTPADGYSKYGSIGQYTLAATPSSPSCNGQLATIFGTGGADNLSGTGSKDVIAGLGGNDTINGLGGNDLLCGNGGVDTVNGGAGSDKLYGAEGADDLNGGDGNDLLRGGAAADDLNGGAGTDDLFGDGGNDKLTGGAGGGDVCTGGPGTDSSGGGCEVKKTIP